MYDKAGLKSRMRRKAVKERHWNRNSDTNTVSATPNIHSFLAISNRSEPGKARKWCDTPPQPDVLDALDEQGHTTPPKSHEALEAKRCER